tara:strand:+ start:1319 stop:1807 length:489 start_codon:yes stop_codon:yes gene_type:complete
VESITNQPPTNQPTNRINTMKNTLNTPEAASLLMADDNAAWSMSGAFALTEYLEQIEEDCGTEIEFDRVAIRCEYSEYESLQEWARFYFTDDQLAELLDCPLKATEMARADALDAMGEHGDAAQVRSYYDNEEEEQDEKIRDYIRDHGQLVEFDGGIIVSEF